MHEITVAQGIADTVAAEAAAHQAPRVLSVTVAVGELAGVVAYYLQAAWPIVTNGTLLEDSTLIVETVGAEGHCPSCDEAFALHDWLDPCPRCGAFSSEVRSGQELLVRSFDID